MDDKSLWGGDKKGAEIRMPEMTAAGQRGEQIIKADRATMIG